MDYTFAIVVTNFVKKCASGEFNKHSAGQGMPHLLWNSKIHYNIPKSLALFTIQSQKNSVHSLLSSFSDIFNAKFNFTITLALPSGLFHSGITTKLKFLGI
jgi:hypothetical protein